MKRKLIFTSVLLILLLGTAAITVFQFATHTSPAQAQDEKSAKPERVMVIAVEEVINGETFSGEVTITFEDPIEVPDESESAFGLLLHRDGNTLTLGTGSIEVSVGVEVVNDQEPVRTVNATHNGAELDVFVTEKTTVYEDITERPDITPADIEAGEKIISRSLTPGSLDQIEENMIVRAWGTHQDGKLLVDVLVYESIK